MLAITFLETGVTGHCEPEPACECWNWIKQVILTTEPYFKTWLESFCSWERISCRPGWFWMWHVAHSWGWLWTSAPRRRSRSLVLGSQLCLVLSILPRTWYTPGKHSTNQAMSADTSTGPESTPHLSIYWLPCWDADVMFLQWLTNQVGEKQVVDLLSHPSNCSKRNDHRHEVLLRKRTRICQL